MIATLEASEPTAGIRGQVDRTRKLTKLLQMGHAEFLKDQFTTGNRTWTKEQVAHIMDHHFVESTGWIAGLSCIDNYLARLAVFIAENDPMWLASQVRHKAWWVHCVTQGFIEMPTQTGYSKSIDTAWNTEVNRPTTGPDFDTAFRDFPDTLDTLLG